MPRTKNSKLAVRHTSFNSFPRNHYGSTTITVHIVRNDSSHLTPVHFHFHFSEKTSAAFSERSRRHKTKVVPRIIDTIHTWQEQGRRSNRLTTPSAFSFIVLIVTPETASPKNPRTPLDKQRNRIFNWESRRDNFLRIYVSCLQFAVG